MIFVQVKVVGGAFRDQIGTVLGIEDGEIIVQVSTPQATIPTFPFIRSCSHPGYTLSTSTAASGCREFATDFGEGIARKIRSAMMKASRAISDHLCQRTHNLCTTRTFKWHFLPKI